MELSDDTQIVVACELSFNSQMAHMSFFLALSWKGMLKRYQVNGQTLFIIPTYIMLFAARYILKSTSTDRLQNGLFWFRIADVEQL
jgi:hypothetical protein